ncbi:MAG: type II toxin-antitoxin system VapC family toxin [Ignisphaera sp.]
MKNIVLDASAVVKWFVREDEFEEMKRVRDLIVGSKVRAYIPALLFIEVSNALRYTEGLTPEDIIKAIGALQKLGLEVVNDSELLEDAIRIAFEKEITVYDSIYLSLAKRVGGVVITYDREMLNKSGGIAMKASAFLKQFATA